MMYRGSVRDWHPTGNVFNISCYDFLVCCTFKETYLFSAFPLRRTIYLPGNIIWLIIFTDVINMYFINKVDVCMLFCSHVTGTNLFFHIIVYSEI